VKAFVLNQERCPQAHRPGQFRMRTLRAGTSDLRSTDCIPGPEKGNFHAYNQFR
jgi:hypothetical protein